jgi:hypothetical protein
MVRGHKAESYQLATQPATKTTKELPKITHTLLIIPIALLCILTQSKGMLDYYQPLALSRFPANERILLC